MNRSELLARLISYESERDAYVARITELEREVKLARIELESRNAPVSHEPCGVVQANGSGMGSDSERGREGKEGNVGNRLADYAGRVASYWRNAA